MSRPSPNTSLLTPGKIASNHLDQTRLLLEETLEKKKKPKIESSDTEGRQYCKKDKIDTT